MLWFYLHMMSDTPSDSLLLQLLANLYCIQNNGVRPKIMGNFLQQYKTTWAAPFHHAALHYSIARSDYCKGSPCGCRIGVKNTHSLALRYCSECNKDWLIVGGVYQTCTENKKYFEHLNEQRLLQTYILYTMCTTL